MNGSDETMSERGGERSEAARRRPFTLRVLLLAVAFFGLAIGFWLTDGDDDEANPEGARIVSAEELHEFAASSATPIYWVGEQPGTEIELSENASGDVVRYLDEGAEPGEASADFLTIASYPLSDPRGELKEVGLRPGGIVRQAEDGREVVSNEGNPNSVYFAGRGNSVQVEIYDPSAERAMDLALSLEIQPAG